MRAPRHNSDCTAAANAWRRSFERSVLIQQIRIFEGSEEANGAHCRLAHSALSSSLQFGQWERLIVTPAGINHHLHHLDTSAVPLRSRSKELHPWEQQYPPVALGVDCQGRCP